LQCNGRFEKETKIWRNSKKPIVIQEFGVPSYKGYGFGGSNQEDQAHYPKK
jgi:hypothetical protein